MTLQNEIEDGRRTIRSESYPMSIGELANLYRDKEIIIRPEFQRLFRWKIDQKSRLVESIMLGIPIPSVFVMQRDTGVWEVVDGLQRLSTILEFMGDLRDEETGGLKPPSTLQATEYLPSLENVQFNDREDEGPSFNSGQRISFKRAKIDLNILLPESDDRAKYELFDRLNTGGSTPTAQEIRNAQMIMRDRSFYELLEGLRVDTHYQNCIGISDRRYEEGYDAELVTRFIVLMNTPDSRLKGIQNIDTFLSREIFEYIEDASFDREKQQNIFLRTFKLLDESTGDDSFRRYDEPKDRFMGPFSVSAFETITTGVGSHIDAWENAETTSSGRLRKQIEGLWKNQVFRSRSGSGMSSAQRIPYTIPEAHRYFEVS